MDWNDEIKLRLDRIEERIKALEEIAFPGRLDFSSALDELERRLERLEKRASRIQNPI